jgi:hypothetical protein
MRFETAQLDSLEKRNRRVQTRVVERLRQNGSLL